MEKTSFKISEILLIVIIICLIFVGINFAKNLILQKQVKSLITQIEKYDTAVNSFTQKYHALPGDLQNTVEYGITKTSTDGNQDNIITDYYSSLTFANGEITNFWMHLSNSKMLDEIYDGKQDLEAKTISTFPLSKLGENTGIIVYGDGNAGKTFYQIGYDYASSDRMYMKDRSLKTKEAFLIDQKIDDANPDKGRVIAVGGNFPNNEENKDCAEFGDYKRKNPSPVCQLKIEVK